MERLLRRRSVSEGRAKSRLFQNKLTEGAVAHSRRKFQPAQNASEFMKSFKLAILAGVSALIILSGCSTVKVTADYDHSAPFGNYRTYAVRTAANGPAPSPTA